MSERIEALRRDFVDALARRLDTTQWWWPSPEYGGTETRALLAALAEEDTVKAMAHINDGCTCETCAPKPEEPTRSVEGMEHGKAERVEVTE